MHRAKKQLPLIGILFTKKQKKMHRVDSWKLVCFTKIFSCEEIFNLQHRIHCNYPTTIAIPCVDEEKQVA